jgi:O-antigen/teichoic acid export membrane protein
MLRAIASNTLAQLVAKFVGAGLTFLTTALIIRLAGTDIFGDLTKSLALIAIGFTIIDFGLNAVVVRSVGQGRTNAASFIELLLTRLFFSLLVVMVLNLFVQLLSGGYTQEIKRVFWLGSSAVIFQGIFTSCNAVFQSRENYWHSTWAVVVGASLSAVLTYSYTLNSPTLFHFLLANTLGYLAMAIVALFFARAHLTLTHISSSRLLVLFKSALPLGLILLASVAASKIDTVILGIYRDSAEVGEYGFAYRIFDVILVLPAFIMNAVYPRLVKDVGHASLRLIKHLSVFMLVSGLILAVVSYYLAPLILLIRPSLTLSVSALRVLLYSLPLFFLTAPLMWNLISLRKERLLLWIYLGAALGNGILNLTFTPLYGVHAAALITGVTELYLFLALLLASRSANMHVLNQSDSLTL